MVKFLLDTGISLYDCDKYNMTTFLYVVGNLEEALAQVFLWNTLDLTANIPRQSWFGRMTVSIFKHRSKNEREGAGANLE
jgi:hypothetical protein